MTKEFTVAPKWFDHLVDGNKTVEGRLRKGKFTGFAAGTRALVRKGGEDGKDAMHVSIKRVTRYPSFRAMLEGEGLRHVLPGVDSVSKGVQVYRKFYSASDEREHGVIAMDLGTVKKRRTRLYDRSTDT